MLPGSGISLTYFMLPKAPNHPEANMSSEQVYRSGIRNVHILHKILIKMTKRTNITCTNKCKRFTTVRLYKKIHDKTKG